MAQNPYQEALDALRRYGRGVISDFPGSDPLAITGTGTRATTPDVKAGPGQVYRDPALTSYSYLDQLGSELTDRLAGAQRVGDVNEIAALQTLLGKNKEDIAESTVGQQAPKIAATEDVINRANLAGFSSPQEASLYQRGIEEEKMRIPLMQTKEQAAGNLLQQRIANQGPLSVEELRQRAAGERLGTFANLIGVGDQSSRSTGRIGSGLPPGSHITVEGVGSYTSPLVRQIPQTLTDKLRAARQAAEVGGTGSQEALSQALANVLAYDPAPAGLKEKIRALAVDPTYKNMSGQGIVDNFKANMPDLDASDVEDILRLWGWVRGGI